MIRKFFASLFLLFFVIFSLTFSVVWGLYDTFLDRDFYTGDFVDLAYGFIVEEIPKNLNLEEQFPDISERDVQALISDVFKTEDLRFVISDVVEQLDSVTISNSSELRLSLPLSWLEGKQHDIAVSLVDFMYEQLPSCSAEEFLNSGVNGFECIPEGYSKLDMVSKVETMLDRNIFSNLPTNIVLSEVDLPDGFVGNLNQLVEIVFKKIFTVFLLLTTLSFVLLSLVVYKPWQRVLRWQVRAVFFASLSVTALFSALLLSPSVFTGIYQLVVDSLPAADENFYRSVYNFVTATLATSVLTYSGPVVFFSILYLIFKKRSYGS